MYIPLEQRILEVTHGQCPYKAKVCDGLCNNCGIVRDVLNADKNTPTYANNFAYRFCSGADYDDYIDSKIAQMNNIDD